MIRDSTFGTTSPTGFEWGYAGSGPAQLALAILADYLSDEDLAVRFHQEFKFRVISKLPHRGWKLSGAEVEREVGSLRRAASAVEVDP